MKRIALLLLLGGCLVPAAFAQGKAEVGVYVDYFRLSQTKTNFAGLGGRFSVGALPHLQLEGELSYDFVRAFNESFTLPGTSTVTVVRTDQRIIHGLFGPKVNLGHGNLQPFVTLKGGFVNFRLDPRPVTLGTFISSVDNLRSKDLNAVLYPGGGLDGHVGPVGLRLDVGDEIYFNQGTHHNFRVAFGPYLRF